ncbi:CarD family transcriptional regulator [Bradyrhizobium sp. STM 3809]|uniref:CarD family transcriptional regulator n=1 Tax=Bradyrhizobium sp. STM 3809 TaxID=551936 RepID=UPI000696F0F1|nr:CarD family transcriptional regulator [Bradyrhizobium sp. STM 3809]
MGLKDWFDRKRRGYTELDEIMNPLVSARLQHFVCINDTPDRPYLRHYFQFLNKGGLREEFIVFYAHTIGGYAYERTAYRKQGEEAYSLLNDRSPWWTSISFLQALGQRLPANTQSQEGHHAAMVHIERRTEPQQPPLSSKRKLSANSPPLATFSTGEHVVYPQHGVGKIVAIETQDIAGKQVEMLVIHFKTEKMTLRVPIMKAGEIGLRRLADEI